MESDFREIISIYGLLSYNETVPVSKSEREEDEKANLLIEDLRILRQHKRVERNIRLAKEAKRIHGFSCKLCGFNFEVKYGDIGKGYIEAHHLQPLAKLRGEKLLLSPEKDFSVLCANCHRMIHRCDAPHDIERFKEMIL